MGETVLALWQGPWVAFQLPLKRGRQTVSAAKKDHSKCWIVGIWCYVEIYKWNYKSRHHWQAIVLTILYYTNILYYTIPYYTDIDIVYQYSIFKFIKLYRAYFMGLFRQLIHKLVCTMLRRDASCSYSPPEHICCALDHHKSKPASYQKKSVIYGPNNENNVWRRTGGTKFHSKHINNKCVPTLILMYSFYCLASSGNVIPNNVQSTKRAVLRKCGTFSPSCSLTSGRFLLLPFAERYFEILNSFLRRGANSMSDARLILGALSLKSAG